jgi:hypothetical protein
MIEHNPDNPPQNFEFTLEELFKKLASRPDILNKVMPVYHQLIAEIVQLALRMSLKGQITVQAKNNKFTVTLWQPCDEDKAVLS